MIRTIILRLKIFILYLWNKDIYDLGKLGSKNIFIFLGADYGNLGDVAITYAQTKYLQENYLEYNVIEIPISQTAAGIKAVKRVVKPNDVIALIGGGNTSDLYDDIEWLRQLVILSFRKQQIIGFPQTFDFSNTSKGRFCLRIAHSVYRMADKLTILAREQNTMQVLKQEMDDIKAVMAPDIVMILDERKPCNRKGVLVCMRSDKEKAIKNEQKKQLISRLTKRFDTIDYQDTQHTNVDKSNRYSKLKYIIAEFRSHEFVVTDRLHGMILCFITGTPALVFDNSNHKISACYEWIKDCGYIKLFQSFDDIETFTPQDNFDQVHNNIITIYKNLSCLKFH